MTAYFGLLDIARLEPGETVLVSAAAGAVGSAVVQIAKIRGCRVVGIAGGSEKCTFVTELGADSCIDYKAPSLKAEFKRCLPRGIDIYFDNVGGECLDMALRRINRSARVVLCGAISQYNSHELTGPASYLALLANRARMEGFIYFDYVEKFGSAESELAQWVLDGKLAYRTHVINGLEEAPRALDTLFEGGNNGKLLLKISEEQ
jgi:NADPH-dependent curcumin reductase CurA